MDVEVLDFDPAAGGFASLLDDLGNYVAVESLASKEKESADKYDESQPQDDSRSPTYDPFPIHDCTPAAYI